MRLSVIGIAITSAVLLSAAGPAAAAMDRDKAMKSCKKEMNWSSMLKGQKSSAATITQLETCVKAKTGK